MLHGSLWDRLVLFSLPLALTNVLQQLFNTADVVILGRFVGRDAMAGVGSMTPLISLFVALFLGLALGSNVVIARGFGKNQPRAIASASHAAFFLSLVLGVVSAGICYPFIDGILFVAGVPKEICPLSKAYFSWYLLGIPAVSLYNFAAAMLRSEGDTTSPFISLAVASVLNIALNYFAVACGFGVEGVALATTISNIASALILFVILLRRPVFGLRPYLRRTDMKSLWSMLAIGLPAAIQGMVFCFSNVIVQSAINSLGPDVIAGSAAAFTIEINMYCLMSAFAQAATTFVSQNYGARNIPRCLRVTRVSLYLTIPLNIVMSLLIVLISPWLLQFFTADPAVLEIAILRIYIIVLPNVITIFIDILSGSLRGYGCSLPPAIASLFAICGIRIAWVFTIFKQYHDFNCLLISYPVSWFVTALLISLVYYRYYRENLRNY